MTKYLSLSENSSSIRNRNEIDSKFKWNLEDIFNNDESWEESFHKLEENSNKLPEFKGILHKSAANLLKCLKFDEEIGINLDRLHLYSMLSKDLDLRSAKYQGMYDRLMMLASKISALSAFIKPEILQLPEETINLFISQEEELSIYKHLLDDIIRTKKHTLSEDQEVILANATPALQVSYNTFGLLNNADLKFPTIKNEIGEDLEISHARYTSAMYSLDRDYRKRFYKSYYKPFMEYKNTFGALFNGNLKSDNFIATTRKYNSTRELALDANNIPLSVYDNLVSSVNKRLQPLHRWAEIKKKYLNIEEFHAYDAYVTLFPSVKKKYAYDDGKEIVLNSLKPLGEKYISDVRFAFENRWIDVYETKGKRSGAYSSGTTFGVHPYVLLNWSDELNDVFTLTHEMGHNMHSFYTGQNQPYPYANYSIFVAEVASTLNEALLLEYLIKNSDSKEEKLFLIEKHINNIVTTFYRQTLFAEFEQTVHDLNSKGDALTPDVLSELYGKLHMTYWGKVMTLDEEETYTWARVPHFYYNFYVYQYATSFAASEALSIKIKEEGRSAVDKYLSFLKSGSSDYPINVLTKTGVDMRSPDPIIAVTEKLNNLLDEFEKLV